MDTVDDVPWLPSRFEVPDLLRIAPKER